MKRSKFKVGDWAFTFTLAGAIRAKIAHVYQVNGVDKYYMEIAGFVQDAGEYVYGDIQSARNAYAEYFWGNKELKK